MPKARLSENKKLPARWVLKHGAYYYRPAPEAKPQWENKSFFRLGETLQEAYRTFAERTTIERQDIFRVSDLLIRYSQEEVPKKSPANQVTLKKYCAELAKVFKDFLLDEVTPREIYQYVDQKENTVTSHRQIEVLSHAFTKAVQWGLIDRHPFKGQVRLEGHAARDRYVTDDEILALLAMKPTKAERGTTKFLQAYIRFKLLVGQRQQDILLLKRSDMGKDGIFFFPRKTQKSSAKKVLIEWNEGLAAAVAEVEALRGTKSEWLFCTEKGACYYNEAEGRATSFKNMWRKFIDRAVTEGVIKERFTEHDLRAKAGSDAESLQAASELLGHANTATTKRVYRRSVQKVKAGKTY
jgi:integrase